MFQDVSIDRAKILLDGVALNSYERVGREYYCKDLHPTCANFLEASANLIGRWMNRIPIGAEIFFEVGCGYSILASILASVEGAFHRLVLIDSSHLMLNYSRQWIQEGAKLVLADASCLPFKSECVDVFVSSLGDSYNVEAFWSEVNRVMRPGAHCIFTSPSFDWANEFRPDKRQTSIKVAEFLLEDGITIHVPSFICPNSEQIILIEERGLIVKEVIEFPIKNLKVTGISPKLLSERRGGDAPIVTGYLIIKPS